MYAMLIYLHLVDFMANVGKHTIHGWYGYANKKIPENEPKILYSPGTPNNHFPL